MRIAEEDGGRCGGAGKPLGLVNVRSIPAAELPFDKAALRIIEMLAEFAVGNLNAFELLFGFEAPAWGVLIAVGVPELGCCAIGLVNGSFRARWVGDAEHREMRKAALAATRHASVSLSSRESLASPEPCR